MIFYIILSLYYHYYHNASWAKPCVNSKVKEGRLARPAPRMASASKNIQLSVGQFEKTMWISKDVIGDVYYPLVNIPKTMENHVQ